MPEVSRPVRVCLLARCEGMDGGGCILMGKFSRLIEARWGKKRGDEVQWVEPGEGLGVGGCGCRCHLPPLPTFRPFPTSLIGQPATCSTLPELTSSTLIYAACSRTAHQVAIPVSLGLKKPWLWFGSCRFKATRSLASHVNLRKKIGQTPHNKLVRALHRTAPSDKRSVNWLHLTFLDVHMMRYERGGSLQVLVHPRLHVQRCPVWTDRFPLSNTCTTFYKCPTFKASLVAKP